MPFSRPSILTSHFPIPTSRRGIAALTLVLILGTTGLLVVSGIIFTLVRQISQEQSVVRSEDALAVAEAGVEEVALRIRRGEIVPSPLTLAVGNGTATVTNSIVGSLITIVSRGDTGSVSRAVEITMNRDTTDVSFFYGIHVGDGGLIMENNATVNGSVFSNGDIVGANGAAITDSAVTSGDPLLLGAAWETQNTDFEFGRIVSGTIVTVVDSTGSVGKYASLTMGSDGFARISYYDDTSDNLKFVRCTNDDCTTKNITTVDSGGDVGKYTAIALGSDGFARISYFDDSNNDLKFVRCTNSDCTTKNITTVDSSGTVGEYSSLALGTDGFARISYFDNSNDDLKFAQCANADCTGRNIVTVDSSGSVGERTSIALGLDQFARISYVGMSSSDLKFVRCTNGTCSTKNITTVDSVTTVQEVTSIALGSDGFARISYDDDGSDDLEFVQCTNADCTTKVFHTIDSAGNVGDTSSLKMGLDDLPRIAYFDDSNGDVKYLRCTNADCTTGTVYVPDSAGDVGEYMSLGMGNDSFARIGYFDDTNDDLKFIRCVDESCAPSSSRADGAQSFTPPTTSTIGRVSLFIKKVGSPASVPVYIMADEGGRPGDSSGDILASGTLAAASVSASYAWVDVDFTSTRVFTSGQTYWLMVDGNLDAANYWIWGLDNTDAYGNGTGRHSSDWTGGVWSNIPGDLNFRTWYGGSKIESVIVGDATKGTGRSQQFVSTTIHGSACPNSFCIFEYVAREELPITDEMIQDWKDGAEVGGTIAGDYTPPRDTTTSLGPVKITGDLHLDDNNQTLNVTGTIWVQGDIIVDNGSTIRLDPSYGTVSGIVLTDSSVHVKNNSAFSGSGQADSYLMVLTTSSCNGIGGISCTHHNAAIDLHNNAVGAIFYASNGLIFLHQGISVTELTAWGIHIEQNSIVTYDSGLANARFSSGPGGGYTTLSWREIVPL